MHTFLLSFIIRTLAGSKGFSNTFPFVIALQSKKRGSRHLQFGFIFLCYMPCSLPEIISIRGPPNLTLHLQAPSSALSKQSQFRRAINLHSMLF